MIAFTLLHLSSRDRIGDGGIGQIEPDLPGSALPFTPEESVPRGTSRAAGIAWERGRDCRRGQPSLGARGMMRDRLVTVPRTAHVTHGAPLDGAGPVPTTGLGPVAPRLRDRPK